MNSVIRHTITNHVDDKAKSARWSVSCSCGWSRSRFNTCATANEAGQGHQAKHAAVPSLAMSR